MVFNGRSLDTFESSVTMLSGGIPVHRHLDCISGRCFFLDGENRETLYSCTLALDEAVENINTCLGNILAVADLENTQEKFVMELNSDIGIPTIFRKTYPFGHYVFCWRRENMIYVNDPDGFPMLSYPIEDFPMMPQVIIKIRQEVMVNKEMILRALKKFISMHKGVALTEPPSRLFMQYAVRNYVCQTNKIVECLREYMEVPETTDKEFTRLFGEMLAVSPCFVDQMNRIDRDIYCLLGELLCTWI